MRDEERMQTRSLINFVQIIERNHASFNKIRKNKLYRFIKTYTCETEFI